eukprot:scpid25289/ scgid23852/ 
MMGSTWSEERAFPLFDWLAVRDATTRSTRVKTSYEQWPVDKTSSSARNDTALKARSPSPLLPFFDSFQRLIVCAHVEMLYCCEQGQGAVVHKPQKDRVNKGTAGKMSAIFVQAARVATFSAVHWRCACVGWIVGATG